MRILHLIDEPGRDRAGRTGGGCEAVDALDRLTHFSDDADHTVCLVGNEAFARIARAGRGVHRIASPAGRPWLALGALRSLVGRIPKPDVIHAWSLPTLHLARAAFGGELPRTGALLTEWRADGAAIECAGTPFVVVSDMFRRACIAAGVPGERIVLAPPPFAHGPPSNGDRADARRSLGIEAGDTLVVHLGFAPFADAVRFVTILTMLDLAGRTAVGLISEEAAQVHRATRLYRSLRPRARLLFTDRSTTSFLAAADAGIYDGGSPNLARRAGGPEAAVVPLAAAAARGLPVIVPEELLFDFPGGLEHSQPCPKGTTAALAHSLSLALGRRVNTGEGPRVQGQDPGRAFTESLSRMWRLACARSATGAVR